MYIHLNVKLQRQPGVTCPYL